MPGTIVTCRPCGLTFDSGFTLAGDIKFTGWTGSGATAIGTVCPRCGADIPIVATDGVWRTGPDGMLVKVRDVVDRLVFLDANVLSALAAEVSAAKAASDDEAAAAALTRAGLGSLLRQEENRMELWAVIGLVLAAIAAILGFRQSQPDQPIPDSDQVCRQVERTVREQTTTEPDGTVRESRTVHFETDVARNQPCPCGSGRKYKRCHGAHPTSSDHPDHRTDDD